MIQRNLIITYVCICAIYQQNGQTAGEMAESQDKKYILGRIKDVEKVCVYILCMYVCTLSLCICMPVYMYICCKVILKAGMV